MAEWYTRQSQKLLIVMIMRVRIPPCPPIKSIIFFCYTYLMDTEVVSGPPNELPKVTILPKDLPGYQERKILFYNSYSSGFKEYLRRQYKNTRLYTDSVHAFIQNDSHGKHTVWFVENAIKHRLVAQQVFRSKSTALRDTQSVIGAQLFTQGVHVKGILLSVAYLPDGTYEGLTENNEPTNLLKEAIHAIPEDEFAEFPDGIIPVGYLSGEGTTGTLHYAGFNTFQKKLVPLNLIQVIARAPEVEKYPNFSPIPIDQPTQ